MLLSDAIDFKNLCCAYCAESRWLISLSWDVKNLLDESWRQRKEQKAQKDQPGYAEQSHHCGRLILPPAHYAGHPYWTQQPRQASSWTTVWKRTGFKTLTHIHAYPHYGNKKHVQFYLNEFILLSSYCQK